MAENRSVNAVVLNSEGADFGFDPGPDDNFRPFEGDFGDAFSSGRAGQDVEDAVILESSPHASGANPFRGRMPGKLEDYLAAIEEWETGSEFVNDAREVDRVRARRLNLAREISDDPHLISNIEFARARKSSGEPFRGDPRSYLQADIAYNDKPDPASARYSDFVQERARMRDELFDSKDGVIVGARDYERFTRRTQGVMLQGEKIAEQYDFIDLRREAALENYDNPAFIAEIATFSPAGQSWQKQHGIVDEFLVDIDRKDLLNEHLNDGGYARSDAMADVFAESVRASPDRDGDGHVSSAEKIAKFQDMRETGRNIRHNHLAIVKFAQQNSTSGDRSTYDLGIAALENTTFSRGLYDRWIDSLSTEDRKFLGKEKSVVAHFDVARKKFEAEFDNGDPAAGKTFAVLEQAASQIIGNPARERRLSDLGNMDNVAALHFFTEGYSERNLGKKAAADLDRRIIDRISKNDPDMDQKKGTFSVTDDRVGGGKLKSPDGKDYDLDLGQAGTSAKISIVDGAHIMISNSAEDAEDGKGAVVRLEGIMAPPPGKETKRGGVDAGVESKSHLEEVVGRYGLETMGTKLRTLDNGEVVAKVRLDPATSGENLSQRMLTDGYALPVKDGAKGDRREHMAKQAESNKRGLWEFGFPEMDESWRRENAGPRMTWYDKKIKVVDNTVSAMAGSTEDVYRKLSQSDTKLFALPLKKWSANSRIDHEVEKVTKKNPTRISSIYDNNIEVLKDLRKRKDKLSQEEKLAHDRLTMGNRVLGSSLVSKNLLDPKQARKNDHEMMSGIGMQMTMKGVRPIADFAKEAAHEASNFTRKGMRAGSSIARGIDMVTGE